MQLSKIVCAAAFSAIGLLVGSQLPRGILSGPVSITTFKIKVPFDQWSKEFDSNETRKIHKVNNIKPIFRGFSNINPNQVVVIHQSKPGVVKRIFSENKVIIESSGHIMKTTSTSNWKSN